MTTVELLEGLADLYELAPQLRDLCRSRAARLREALERTALDLESWRQAGDMRIESIIAAKLDALTKLNAPSSTPIAKDQP